MEGQSKLCLESFLIADIRFWHRYTVTWPSVSLIWLIQMLVGLWSLNVESKNWKLSNTAELKYHNTIMVVLYLTFQNYVFNSTNEGPHQSFLTASTTYLCWRIALSFFTYINSYSTLIKIKLRKGKALRKHNPHGKTAASVLLKLFISGNERCHTIDAPKRMSGTLFLNVNDIQSMIPEDQKNITTHWWSTGRHITAATHAGTSVTPHNAPAA